MSAEFQSLGCLGQCRSLDGTLTWHAGSSLSSRIMELRYAVANHGLMLFGLAVLVGTALRSCQIVTKRSGLHWGRKARLQLATTQNEPVRAYLAAILAFLSS
ncbi:hypothetical protein MASR1M42_00470 [Azonexus hydrophilus]